MVSAFKTLRLYRGKDITGTIRHKCVGSIMNKWKKSFTFSRGSLQELVVLSRMLLGGVGVELCQVVLEGGEWMKEQQLGGWRTKVSWGHVG